MTSQNFFIFKPPPPLSKALVAPLAPTLWCIIRMASHNYFKMTKKKFNKFYIKLLNNWIKYKLDPVFKNHLWQTQTKIQVWLVTSSLPPYPKHFLIGFRRFIKMAFVRSRGTVSPIPPVPRRADPGVGGSAPKPPLASGGWRLRLQTPELLLPSSIIVAFEKGVYIYVGDTSYDTGSDFLTCNNYDLYFFILEWRFVGLLSKLAPGSDL